MCLAVVPVREFLTQPVDTNIILYAWLLKLAAVSRSDLRVNAPYFDAIWITEN